MCGIAGEVCFTGNADVAAVERMAAVLAPRGPEGCGTYAQDGVALAHRRLKIIDLAASGGQPMVDPQLGLAIVFNGCIYNYRELRADLEREGYRFFSHSDTEVLLKAYDRWGEAFVEHLHDHDRHALLAGQLRPRPRARRHDAPGLERRGAGGAAHGGAATHGGRRDLRRLRLVPAAARRRRRWSGFATDGADEPLDRALRLDTEVMLVDDPVKRVDNMTMAWGLEARVPFLDHELVELAVACPPELKLVQGGKGVLKDAARRVVPSEVIDRPKGSFPDRLLAAPNDERTPLGSSKLWQLGVLELWLQAHDI